MSRFFVFACTSLLFFSCAAPKPIQYQGLQIADVQLLSDSKLKLVANVQFYNPNAYNVKIWQASATCTIAGKKTGMAKLDTMILLPALVSVTIPLGAEISTKELLGQSLQLALGGSIGYTVQGTAKAGKRHLKWNFPFTYTGHLTQKDLQVLFK